MICLAALFAASFIFGFGLSTAPKVADNSTRVLVNSTAGVTTIYKDPNGPVPQFRDLPIVEVGPNIRVVIDKAGLIEI